MSQKTIRIFCTSEGGATCTLEIDPDEPVEDMGVLIEVELGIPVLEQVLVAADGRVLESDKTLANQGIHADTHVRVMPRGPATQQEGGEAPVVPQQENIHGERFELHRDPFVRGPLSPASIGAPDMPAGGQQRDVFGSTGQRQVPTTPEEARLHIERLFQEGARQLHGQPVIDETDPDVQRRLYEAIKWQNVNQNLESAYEFMPELFIRVPMLFVNCEINKVTVKAFIDSGAQKSIMNVRSAEQCGLMHLLDTRASTLMRGVGLRRSLGVVHMAVVNLCGLHIPFSLTIIDDDKMDFIIGLDQMKLHRMIIDLDENCLKIAGTKIPFLPDSEVPELITGDEIEDEMFRKAKEEDAKEEHVGAVKASEGTLVSAERDEEKKNKVIATTGANNTTEHTSVLRSQPGGSGDSGGSSSGGAAADASVDKETLIATVMTLTRIDRNGAVSLLEAAGWNADLAMSLFLSE